MRVTVARVADADVAQGTVGIERKSRVLLGCANGALELVRVWPDGKREMEARAWAQGAPRDALAWDRP